MLDYCPISTEINYSNCDDDDQFVTDDSVDDDLRDVYQVYDK